MNLIFKPNPFVKDLGDTVDRVKELLKKETRIHSPSGTESPVSNLKNRSFYGAAPSFESNRDATIYKFTDEEPTSAYKPKWRHDDRLLDWKKKNSSKEWRP